MIHGYSGRSANNDDATEPWSVGSLRFAQNTHLFGPADRWPFVSRNEGEDTTLSIRLLLALTAVIACAIVMMRVFWFGDGIPGATLPALLVGETAWIGMLVVCLVILHEDRKKRSATLSDGVVLLTLMAMIAMQVAVPLKLLRDFGAFIAG